VVDEFVLSASPPGTAPPHPPNSYRIGGRVGPKADLQFEERKKKFWYSEKSKARFLRRPERSLVATVTKIFRLPFLEIIFKRLILKDPMSYRLQVRPSIDM
jgi:hypothetical protein